MFGKGQYVVNGEEMSQRKFQLWLGKTVNIGMVRKLRDKGYSEAKISEITGLDQKMVARYLTGGKPEQL
jgi:hypothetical protein